MKKKILVTGATGNIAGFAIPQHLQAGATVHAYVPVSVEAVGEAIIAAGWGEWGSRGYDGLFKGLRRRLG